MKAHEAPEKIYIPTILAANVVRYKEEGSIEYVRTDAFIEKATKWLIDNIQNYTDDEMGEHSFVLVQDLKEDFKKYMEG